MTVEDYITKQTPEVGAISRWLQQIIHYAASGVREEVVPFYTYRKQPLCYLNVLKTTQKDQPIRVDLFGSFWMVMTFPTRPGCSRAGGGEGSSQLVSKRRLTGTRTSSELTYRKP
ncbi:hypothetical protein [Spirosoma spitsbergense]|uniref:hypothetical protein n=1 Tax=Spirosoma spitsbergense TaxID=431554 RepID=UPI0012F891E2|nr:hypothetical protein [Spirosoma spitsbergense]